MTVRYARRQVHKITSMYVTRRDFRLALRPAPRARSLHTGTARWTLEAR